MDYIRSLEKPDTNACFLCDAGPCCEPDALRQRLILWTTPLTVTLINRFPYTNGHLLISPRRHVAELELMTDEEGLDLHRQTVRAIELLRRAMNPQGFNIGINLGRAAGAGVPGHLHQHVVPRWSGDTNYMTVVGEVRVMPQALSQLWDDLNKHVTAFGWRG